MVLSEIVDALDMSTLLSSYKNGFKGTSAYHPVMLVKVLFYGYMNATFSSRRIASKLTQDLAYMFLSGNQQPDFRTINRFRKEKWEQLTSLFAQIVRKAQELWLISFGTISIDGTKIYADASKYKNMDIETLEQKMKKLMEEAEEVDTLEDGEFWENGAGSNIPPKLKTREGREKRRKEIEEKKMEIEEKRMEIEEKKKFVRDHIGQHQEQWITMKRINTTDTDSRMMQMKKKDFANGYNPQIATENQIILASTVPNSAWDVEELLPVLKTLQKLHKQTPKQVLADKGYASEANYEYLKQSNIDGYIPHPKIQGKLSGNLEWWKYDMKRDEYTDPDRNIYRFKQHSGSKTKRWRWRPTLQSSSEPSDFKSKVYNTKTDDGKIHFLSISEWWLSHCKQQDEKLSTQEGKALYQKRCHDVEPVFGNIKRNLKFERFSLRWFQWVQIEWDLITIAHNLKKIMRAMKNIPV